MIGFVRNAKVQENQPGCEKQKVAFWQRDVGVLCESSRDLSAVRKILLLYELIAHKKTPTPGM